MTWDEFVMPLFGCALIAIIAFVIGCVRAEKLHFLHKLYLALALCYAEWIVPLMIMEFVDPNNKNLLFILDCFTSVGGLLGCALYLAIVVAFVKGLDWMPRWFPVLFIIPVITIIVTFTNPLHHLQYEVFSIHRNEIVFGPFIAVSGFYSYICLVSSVVILLYLVLTNNSILYIKQCLLMGIGGMAPLIVNVIATFSDKNLPITATPAAFIITIITNGIAIYQLHLLDVKPIAVRHVLDGISDCYMILSASGLVIDFNRPFSEIFASSFGIVQNQYLRKSIREEDITNKTAAYNMLTAIDTTRRTGAAVAYEQSMTVREENGVRRKYYVAEVSPIILHGTNCGSVIMFKDMTQLKESMQQLQKSRERMMEQENLAFLGQMIGGLAHNLKTPIMGISGCIAAGEALVEECEESIGDKDVTEEDYREIYEELRGWFRKIKDSTAYMSDIITAIKGQTTNVAVNEDSVFGVEDTLKRCTLLIRHEMQLANCVIHFEYDETKEIFIRGDMNNLVQVLVNLLSNAIYSQKQTGGGKIIVRIETDEEEIRFLVIDHGMGVSSQVREKLFKAMVTNKGAMGTGIGLYISNTVIKGKFEGKMWMEDNPEGGAVFGVSIPKSRVSIHRKDIQREEG